MTNPPPAPEPPNDAARFRSTLVRVMGVQLVTLILLWLVQSRFSV